MKEAGFEFEVETPKVDEVFPQHLAADAVARYLAWLKADAFRNRPQDRMFLTADTVVILDGQILNKPVDRDEALKMLQALSGNTHTVKTGVCILVDGQEIVFDDTTLVTFTKLSRNDVEFYVDTFQPYDKAGAYGAQDGLPSGMNPCSEEEMQFLKTIGKESLVEKTIAPSRANNRPVLIKELAGSYFNVMGLPIHKIYQQLKKLAAA